MHRPGREPERGETPQSNERPLDIPGRERVHRLYPESLQTMRTVGSFRVVNAADIRPKTQARLIREGLMERATIRPTIDGPEIQVLTLTDEGRRILESQQTLEDRQKYHSGIQKPVELAHDIAVYPAYLKEVIEIEKAGGTIKRVLLDLELRAYINSEKPELREQAAQDLNLTIVDGKILLPDARIEYENAEGRDKHLDIEVITRDYSRAQIASKVSAGFKLHAPPEIGPKTKVWDSNTYNWV